MIVTYSFHISSKNFSIFNKRVLVKVSNNNNRKYENDEYNKDLNNLLIGSNNIFEDVKNLYTNEFTEVLNEYNEKQYRDDRKINDYFEHVSNSNKDLAVEIIIQVGDMDFWKDKNFNDRKKMDDIFKNQIDKLQNELPNFKIANAIIHYDESSPHMHIVGVPISQNFKRGMKKQVSKGKVFNKNVLENLQDVMRENIENEMKHLYGNDISLKSKSKGRNKNFTKEEYIEAKEKGLI